MSGEIWEERIKHEIKERDIFYLFWSKNAKASKWVEMEWKTALKWKGIEFIDPIPLDSPEIAPPPTELSKIHFNDWFIPYIKS